MCEENSFESVIAIEDLYRIAVSDSTHDWLVDNWETDNVFLFCDITGNYNFAIVHGEEDGRLNVGGNTISQEEFMHLLINKGMLKPGSPGNETVLNIISCYGEFRDDIIVNNVRFDNLLPDKGEIYLATSCDIYTKTKYLYVTRNSKLLTPDKDGLVIIEGIDY